mgnify:CR=1 FL=1|jgi:polysaccharide export outer membrane protein
MMMKLYIPLSILAVAAFLCGCTYTPFGPVTIPTVYSVKPPEPIKEDELEAELRRLHEVDQAPYRIMAGDQFNFSVYEQPELEALRLVVTPDGYVALPLIGPVKIGGMSLVDATTLLVERFSKYIRSPLVSLIPYWINGYNFTIAGRVNQPGCYTISVGQTRLIEAVALAKGLEQGLFQGDSVEMADLDNAYVSRNGKLLPVSFRKAIVEGDPLHNIPLRNGDYIYIPSVMNSTVALLGEVNRQTYVGFKEGMTLTGALTFGAGLRETHSANANIIRGGLKNPVIYIVDIKKILEGKAMDFPLQPNDIVYIPPDGISEWNIIVRKIMPSLQSINMMAGPFGNPSGYINYAN